MFVSRVSQNERACARETSYEKEIADFRANPDAYAEESSSEESSDSDSDSDSDSSSDDDDDDSSEEESDSDDDDDDSDADESDDDSDASSAGGTTRGVGEAKASKPVKTQKVMNGCILFGTLFVCCWCVDGVCCWLMAGREFFPALWLGIFSRVLLVCGWGPGMSWV